MNKAQESDSEGVPSRDEAKFLLSWCHPMQRQFPCREWRGIIARVRILILLFTIACTALSAAEMVPLRKLKKAEQEQKINGDMKSVLIYRHGLEDATSFALKQTNFFTSTSPAITDLPRREQKDVLWQTWKAYLDYMVALDAIEHYHAEFYTLSGVRRDRAFVVSYAAFLAKYRSALLLADAGKKSPFLDKILNEPVPELGLPAGSYAKLKFRYLNVAAAAEFDASRAIYATISSNACPELRDGIASDAAFVARMGYGKGQVLAINNALKILRNAGEKAWFPIQSGVAEWMGDTKVYRRGKCLITQEQLHELQPKLQPGDVLLIRHDWYLSNIGLPGFWPHAALYIGTPQERTTYFNDGETSSWVRSQKVASGSFEDLLRLRSGSAYEQSLVAKENKLPRILEAISEGVSLTALEQAADADSVVVLRPRLSKVEKATAIARAFHYAGRPYDFNFDFRTDSELVCTELVFKAYEPAQAMRGLRFPLVEMLGRPVLPANEIARQFDSQCDTPEAQFDFITFLDASEREGKANVSTLAKFRESWRRPKWHLLTQK